jgi:hypothetical protein
VTEETGESLVLLVLLCVLCSCWFVGRAQVSFACAAAEFCVWWKHGFVDYNSSIQEVKVQRLAERTGVIACA